MGASWGGSPESDSWVHGSLTALTLDTGSRRHTAKGSDWSWRQLWQWKDWQSKHKHQEWPVLLATATVMLSVSYMRSLPLAAFCWNTIVTPSDNYSISCDRLWWSAEECEEANSLCRCICRDTANNHASWTVSSTASQNKKQSASARWDSMSTVMTQNNDNNNSNNSNSNNSDYNYNHDDHK